MPTDKGLTVSQWAKFKTQDLPKEERRATLPPSTFSHTLGDHLRSTDMKGSVLHQLLQSGGKLVLVGGKLDELPRVLRTHAQIVCWDTTLKSWHDVEFPDNTKAVVYNQWVTPRMKESILRLAKNRGVILLSTANTKELAELAHGAIRSEPIVQVTQEQAEQVVQEAAREAEAPVEHPEGHIAPAHRGGVPVGLTTTPQASRRPARLGEIPAFLTYHHAETGGDPGFVAQRLLPKLHALGIEQSQAALTQNIRNYRKLLARGLDKTSGPGATVALAVEEARRGTYRFPGQETPPAPPVVAPAASQPPPQALLEQVGQLDVPAVTQLVKNAIDLLKQAQPLLEKLKDILPALELVDGELPKVKAEIDRLNKIREAMR